MDSVLFECVALSFDALFFSICYGLYKRKNENTKLVESAEYIDINNKLSDKVKKSNGVIPYVAVRGTVKAIGSSLRSQYLPHVRGVIREKITKERKVKWNPVLRMWSTIDQDVQRFQNTVPFTLIGNSHWFTSKVQVEDPLSAEELELSTLYNHFYSSEGNLKDAFVGWFQGERTTGVHEIENMLSEDTLMTGIGELVIEDDILKLKPPTSGATYYLTPLTFDSLLKKLKEEVRFFKIVSIMLATLGTILLSTLVFKYYRIKKRKWATEKAKKMQQEASLRRRIENPQRFEDIDSFPHCVICLLNPIEVIILECGHACLCLNCSERVTDSCPVCRSYIDRIVPAYLP